MTTGNGRAGASAVRVRLYIVENDTWRGRNLALAVLETMRREGGAGATVFNGVMGFGAHGRIRTGAIVDAAMPLSQVIEWVDRPERVERLLPTLREMASGALITMEEVRVLQFAVRALRDIATNLRVRDAMTPEERVVAAPTDAGLDELVTLLLRHGRHAAPVVDRQRRVVGIVTENDLITRAGLPLRLMLLRALGDPDEPAVAAHLAGLRGEGQTTASIMTTEVTTVSPDMSLNIAARTLLQSNHRQVPVVDAEGRLAGMLSQFDILRTAANTTISDDESPPRAPGGGAPPRRVAEALHRRVPTVRPDAPLPEVLDAVATTLLHCAVVVDAQNRPLGVVADTDLLRLVTPGARPGLLQRLMHQLRPGTAEEREGWQRLTGQRAADVMHPRDELLVVPADAPLAEVIDRVLAEGSYRVTVVDDDGRLIGMANRADLVAAMAATI